MVVENSNVSQDIFFHFQALLEDDKWFNSEQIAKPLEFHHRSILGLVRSIAYVLMKNGDVDIGFYPDASWKEEDKVKRWKKIYKSSGNSMLKFRLIHEDELKPLGFFHFTNKKNLKISGLTDLFLKKGSERGFAPFLDAVIDRGLMMELEVFKHLSKINEEGVEALLLSWLDKQNVGRRKIENGGVFLLYMSVLFYFVHNGKRTEEDIVIHFDKSVLNNIFLRLIKVIGKNRYVLNDEVKKGGGVYLLSEQPVSGEIIRG